MVISQRRHSKFVDEVRRGLIETEETSKKLAQREQSEDTKNRCEINKIIRDSIVRGKQQVELTEELLSNPKFKKYEPYIRNWVNDQYAKCGSLWKKEKTANGQERD